AQPEPAPQEAPAEATGTPEVPGAEEWTPTSANWARAALTDERAKRKALASRVAELETERALFQQQQQEELQQSASDQFWSAPEEHYARLHQRAQDATLAGSEAKLISYHGKETYDAMSAAIEDAIKRGHPDMPVVAERMRQSSDPAGVALEWYQQSHYAQP